MSDELAKVDPVAVEPSFRYSTPQTYVPGSRRLTIEFPGNVTVTGPRGYYPGCRMVRFRDFNEPEGLSAEDRKRLHEELGGVWRSTVDQVNCYFDNRANLSLVESTLAADGSSLTGLLTRQLEGRELELFQEAGRQLDVIMTKLREEDAEVAAKAEAAAAEKAANDKDALEVGRKALEHNIFGQLREASAKIVELQTELKALKKRVTP